MSSVRKTYIYTHKFALLVEQDRCNNMASPAQQHCTLPFFFWSGCVKKESILPWKEETMILTNNIDRAMTNWFGGTETKQVIIIPLFLMMVSTGLSFIH